MLLLQQLKIKQKSFHLKSLDRGGEKVFEYNKLVILDENRLLSQFFPLFCAPISKLLERVKKVSLIRIQKTKVFL